ncbi:hypothetical protein [Aestuariibaculum sediminum]|uniref:Uncharacterized protein n=1 Tax=Aestuariibaculum sediminum TaxID=2770637 RepID=A0A8J6Q4K2_9FLAO|nr:hypothetical protein [Aestuariibaculum sediminum]MBD0833800.1 hypothetical protein [Aestuariibaculum sediminum]
MDKLTFKTESYLINGKNNERFFPFLELEYNEWVIYENDIPKYFIGLHSDVESDFEIINWLLTELKNGKNLRNLILELGKKYNKNWDIFPSQRGLEIENSYQTEQLELEVFTDKTIDKIKTTPQHRL